MEQSYLHALAGNDTKKDPGSGGHRDSGSTSLAAILATLIPTAITAAIFLAIFVTIRISYRKIYAPRTYLATVPQEDRTPSSDLKGRDWFRHYRTLNDKFVLQHQSLDGYLFLRFFKFIVAICFLGCCITWPILFPVNATGNGGAKQLDRISISNIKGSTPRLWAHAIVAWLFLGSVMFLVARERLILIGIRQAYTSSRYNASRLSPRVVLFLSVPNEALQKDKLHKVFGSEAQESWPVLELDDLDDLVSERNDKAMKLESAEIKFLRNVNKKRLAKSKSPDSSHENGDSSDVTDDSSRPTHMSKTGKKVDTINWARKAIPDLADRIQKLRETPTEGKEEKRSAVFVSFSTQAAAQRACKQIQFHPQLPTNLPTQLPTHARYLDVQPKEVLWANVTLKPSIRVSRAFAAWVFVIAIIIFWAIPIGIVGTLTNINYLTDKLHFLRFINNLPTPILGLITGLLPPYLMSTFVSYVPKFFRYIAKLSGEPTLPQAELKTQAWYFIFQVIQVFLVTTFSSGAAAVFVSIANDPSSAPTYLALNLPMASNFYLSYFILQGVASAAKNVLNYSDLLEYLIMGRFFDKTPRDKYTRYTRMKGISWGSLYPKFTNMVVIALAYSCIAPLVLGFATAGLSLFYLSYRYNLLYVIQTKVDTRGECYARALQHLLTGVYLSTLCLIGLFGVHKAPGPSALMVLLLVVTIIWHAGLNTFIIPLEANFVVDNEGEIAPLLAAEEGGVAEDDDDNEAGISHIQAHAFNKLPETMSTPMARFLDSYISVSRETTREWLTDPSARDLEDEAPSLSDEELKNAYLNPALTSKMPKLWLARDEMGISKKEIEENEKVGIAATDEGAWLNEDNRVEWEVDDLGKVPVFKKPARSGI